MVITDVLQGVGDALDEVFLLDRNGGIWTHDWLFGGLATGLILPEWRVRHCPAGRIAATSL
jgi:hypothetical protein